MASTRATGYGLELVLRFVDDHVALTRFRGGREMLALNDCAFHARPCTAGPDDFGLPAVWYNLTRLKATAL